MQTQQQKLTLGAYLLARQEQREIDPDTQIVFTAADIEGCTIVVAPLSDEGEPEEFLDPFRFTACPECGVPIADEEAPQKVSALEDIYHWLRCAAYIACGTVLGVLSLPLIFIAFLIAIVMLLFKHATD